MSRLIVDAQLPEKLKQLQHPVEFVDSAGHVLGTYLPHTPVTALEPQPRRGDTFCRPYGA